jgi:hypothetical protein
LGAGDGDKDCERDWWTEAGFDLGVNHRTLPLRAPPAGITVEP